MSPFTIRIDLVVDGDEVAREQAGLVTLVGPRKKDAKRKNPIRMPSLRPSDTSSDKRVRRRAPREDQHR